MEKEIQIETMKRSHVSQVWEIEKQCFATPWSKQALIKELQVNRLALYFVAIYNDIVAGYAGMWKIVDEGHITNIAVLPQLQGQGIGSALLERLIEAGKISQLQALTLEVRVGNQKARSLYEKYGFRIMGIRKEYYQDNREDGYIMWKSLSQY
ncbi:MAG: ribosomal protein S18-alanine N-acetyltransferase [Epulopiscium sp.]|nr:ribosomal protein S18-alanine N-acetyltransferase [Candidatus Epulonipiscium sp.]